MLVVLVVLVVLGGEGVRGGGSTHFTVKWLRQYGMYPRTCCRTHADGMMNKNPQTQANISPVAEPTEGEEEEGRRAGRQGGGGVGRGRGRGSVRVRERGRGRGRGKGRGGAR